MNQLIINIGCSKVLFGAYAENCEKVFAEAPTLEACRDDVYEVIRILKEEFPSDQCPEILRGDYEIVWRYDMESIIRYYGSIMSLSGMQKVTGIHQKQLWSYMHGMTKPRKPQRDKIILGMRSFANSILSVCSDACVL